MKHVALALVVFAACKSKDTTEPAPTGAAGSGSAVAKPEKPAGDEPAPKGVTIQHQVADFSGNYELAFAQGSDADHQITIAFVRGCPSLTGSPEPWEAEQARQPCPK